MLPNRTGSGSLTTKYDQPRTGAPLIDKLGLPTEKGRFTVQADLQLPKHLNGYTAGGPRRRSSVVGNCTDLMPRER